MTWFAWNYYSIRRAAHFIDNADFASRIHTSQVIDIREATSFKPVLLYAESRSTVLPRVIRTLKRAGFTDLYVLNDGFDYWTGKVKEG